ncbi:MAG TPA: oligosaccharide flippase family protein [Jiangellales bacterium]|nr:oligosaccharide flippase family protein [Jiangellales bacterium]
MSGREPGPDEIGARSVRGGAFLVAREGSGLAIRMTGLLVVTRLLGPESFGLYAGAAAIVAVVAFLAQLSSETYLVRRRDEPSDRVYDEAFTLLLVSSAVAVATGLLVTTLLPGLLADPRMTRTLQVLLLGVPITVLWAPAQARLERAYRYRGLAALEVAGDLVLYGVAVGGILLGLGHWAMVLAAFAWRLLLLVGSMRLARYRPRLRWRRASARDQARYGIAYVVPVSVWMARSALNPVLVGHFVGTAAVGVVALSIQLVETMNAFTRVVWRVGSVGIGRLQHDTARLAALVRDSTAAVLGVQALTMLPLVALSPWLVPLAFGAEWTAVVAVLPALCAAAMLAAPGLPGTIVLTTLDRMGLVARVQAVRLALLLGSAPPLLIALGAPGFGVAECVALLAQVLLLRSVRHEVPELRLGFLLPVYAAVLPPLAWHLVPGSTRPLLLVPAVVAACLPASRRAGLLTVRRLRGSLRRPTTPVATPAAEVS